MSENEKKWSCEYCTYENYQSAVKCTMCRGPRPFISEDIYSLHINDDRNNSATGSCDNKHHGNPLVSASNLHDYMQPLKITQHSDLAQSLSQSRNNSPPASSTKVENTKIISMDKWTCMVCISSKFSLVYCAKDSVSSLLNFFIK